MGRLVRILLAYFRLSNAAICEMSIGLDANHDFHDYPDDVDGGAYHFMPLHCKRCGKRFYI